jgi:hypothetical protein
LLLWHSLKNMFVQKQNQTKHRNTNKQN